MGKARVSAPEEKEESSKRAAEKASPKEGRGYRKHRAG